MLHITEALHITIHPVLSAKMDDLVSAEKTHLILIVHLATPWSAGEKLNNPHAGISQGNHDQRRGLAWNQRIVFTDHVIRHLAHCSTSGAAPK